MVAARNLNELPRKCKPAVRTLDGRCSPANLDGRGRVVGPQGGVETGSPERVAQLAKCRSESKFSGASPSASGMYE